MSLIERIEGYFAKPAHWHHDNHTEAGALLREALAALKEVENLRIADSLLRLRQALEAKQRMGPIERNLER